MSDIQTTYCCYHCWCFKQSFIGKDDSFQEGFGLLLFLLPVQITPASPEAPLCDRSVCISVSCSGSPSLGPALLRPVAHTLLSPCAPQLRHMSLLQHLLSMPR